MILYLNEAEWESSTSGINVSLPGKDKNGNKPKPDKNDGITPNFAGSDGEDDSTTKSGISEGTIDIRDKESQKQDIEDLNRDTTNTNDPLDKIFDKDKILEKEQAAALFGEIGFTLAGDIISKNDWKNDDPRSIALHGIIGGIMAEISGGSFGEGMTAAAINKLVIAKLGEMRETVKDDDGNPILGPDGKPLTKPVFDGDELRWISAGLGGLISGNQGAGITDSATKNNYLTHAQSNEWLKLRGECDSTDDPSQCKIDIDKYYVTLDRLQYEWTENDKIKNSHYYDEEIISEEVYAKYFKENSDVEKNLEKPLIMEQLESKIDYDKTVREKQLKEGVFQINSFGEKVYTQLPEHLKIEYEKLGIDGNKVLAGSTMGRENDFWEIAVEIEGAPAFAIRADRFGGYWISISTDLVAVDLSKSQSPVHASFQTGVIINNATNQRVETQEHIQEFISGADKTLTVQGFGFIKTESEPLINGDSLFEERLAGLSTKLLPSISIGVGATERIPDSIVEKFGLKYILPPPSLNGMTEEEVAANIKFYRENPHLKPFR